MKRRVGLPVLALTVALTLVLLGGAACSTGPCPTLQGLYTVQGTCDQVPERCPFSQSGCGGTFICNSGLACNGTVDTAGNASFSCAGPVAQGSCTGKRAASGVISLMCIASGMTCTMTLTPVPDAG
jgi:hypothetical protein